MAGRGVANRPIVGGRLPAETRNAWLALGMLACGLSACTPGENVAPLQAESAGSDLAIEPVFCIEDPSLGRLDSRSVDQLWALYKHHKLCSRQRAAADEVLRELIARNDAEAMMEQVARDWDYEDMDRNTALIDLLKRSAALGSVRAAEALESIRRGGSL